MNTLKISQHEDRRYLVQRGRELHNEKIVRQTEYFRKKIGFVDKKTDVYLTSRNLKLVGRIDEVLFFENNKASPLDYKFAEWEGKIYKTHKIQQTLYALLIEEYFNVLVERAFLVYTRSKNHLEEITITKNMKKLGKMIVEEIFDILNLNYFPKGTTYKKRCEDCTYRNLC